MKKVLFFIGVSVFTTLILQAQTTANSILGTWKTGEGNAHVQIFLTQANTYAGKVVWLREPIDPETKLPKLDKRNPQKNLKSKPVLGLVNLWGFAYDEEDKKWKGGHIYDPQNGKDYSCKMTLVNNNKLDVRGFIGVSLLGRTDTWTRVN